MEKIDGCEFFDHQNRRKRVLSQVQVMQAKIGDATHREPVLIHNDAHVENVILDTEKTCRLLDYGNIKWSCPEQELAVIQTHCIGPRMGVFAQILEKYINRYPFDVDLFRLFVLIDASSKIGTRKKPEKQRFLWDTLVEPLLK